jgi:hypothetical protein
MPTSQVLTGKTYISHISHELIKKERKKEEDWAG